uniref:FoP_duplication domain-containing protein n=1 Tax=Panagrellus redivivus TaxID=6233 RepID=A0A7E4ZT98_PANRE
MASQLTAECDLTVSPRSKVAYDQSLKQANVNCPPHSQNRRNSGGNNRRSDHRQQNRRRFDCSRHGNPPAFHQRRSNGQRRNNYHIQRRSDYYTIRRSPKHTHAMQTIHKKQYPVTRAPPKNRRPNQKAEVKPTADDLDRELEAYMKRPVSG